MDEASEFDQIFRSFLSWVYCEVQRNVMMGLTGRAAFSDQGGTHYLPLVELLHHTYSRMECVRMIRGTSVLTHVLFLFNRLGPTTD